MSTARKITSISPETYFEMEDAATVRHEYHAGEVLAMSGSTADHSLIISNINAELRAAVRGTTSRTYSSDLKVHLHDFDSYVYPDTIVVCGPPQFHEGRRDIIINPKLIVEVLSDSTALFDRGMKFTKYRAVPSLQEYVLIEQKFMQLDCYFRNGNGDWIYSTYQKPADQVHFRSLGISVPLAAIYEGLELPPAPDQVEPELV